MELFCKGSIFHRTIEKLSSLDNFLLRILIICYYQFNPVEPSMGIGKVGSVKI